MINRVNTMEPVPEIIAVLHKHAIPLALIPQVFDNVQEEIKTHTIPYKPATDEEKILLHLDDIPQFHH